MASPHSKSARLSAQDPYAFCSFCQQQHKLSQFVDYYRDGGDPSNWPCRVELAMTDYFVKQGQRRHKER